MALFYIVSEIYIIIEIYLPYFQRKGNNYLNILLK